MADLSFQVPPKILYGIDTIHELPQFISGKGTRALIICDEEEARNEHPQQLADSLKSAEIDALVFSEIGYQNTSNAIQQAIDLTQQSYTQIVIGLGDIRVLSAAKIVAALGPGNPNLYDYFNAEVPDWKPLHFVSVPTCCLDPFFLLHYAPVSDWRDGTPRVVFTQQEMAVAAFFDPRLSIKKTGREITLAEFSAVLMIIEGLAARSSSFLSNPILLKALAGLSGNLRLSDEEAKNLTVRANAMQAGLLGSIGLGQTGVGPSSLLAMGLGGAFGISAPAVGTILLPHVLDFLLPSNSERLRAIASALKPSGEQAEENDSDETKEFQERIAETVRTLMGRAQVRTRLGDMNVPIDDLLLLVPRVLEMPYSGYTDGGPTGEALKRLVQSAY